MNTTTESVNGNKKDNGGTPSSSTMCLKVSYKGEMHRMQVSADAMQTLKYETLASFFTSSFPDLEDFVIQFFDDTADGNTRFVISDDESLMAVVMANTATNDDTAEEENVTGSATCKSLKFFAQSKQSAALYDVTEPILKAIEKLIAQLNGAMKSIVKKAKDEEWEANMKRSFSATGEAISAAAEDAKRSISNCKEQVEAFPIGETLNEVMKDTTEGIKLAALEISNFAHEFAKQVSHELNRPVTAATEDTTKTTQTAPVTEQVETSVASEEVATPAASVEEQTVVAPTIVCVEETAPVAPAVDEVEVASSSDDEWDVVAEPEENSAEYLKWKTKIDMIREFFPDCDLKNTCELLNRFKGEVNNVLNELAEL